MAAPRPSAPRTHGDSGRTTKRKTKRKRKEHHADEHGPSPYPHRCPRPLAPTGVLPRRGERSRSGNRSEHRHLHGIPRHRSPTAPLPGSGSTGVRLGEELRTWMEPRAGGRRQLSRLARRGSWLRRHGGRRRLARRERLPGQPGQRRAFRRLRQPRHRELLRRARGPADCGPGVLRVGHLGGRRTFRRALLRFLEAPIRRERRRRGSYRGARWNFSTRRRRDARGFRLPFRGNRSLASHRLGAEPPPTGLVPARSRHEGRWPSRRRSLP